MTKTTGASPILHYDISLHLSVKQIRVLGGGGVWHNVKLDWSL